MKYILIGVLLIMGALFYLMSQSNKADAERLKQAEVAHQQRLEQNRLDAIKAEKKAESERIKSEEAKALKAEQDRLTSEKNAKEFEQVKQAKAAQESVAKEQGNKYSEEDWLVICKSSASAAKSIMSSRQRGAAMTEMMDKVVRPAEPFIRDIIKAFVIDAYSRPRFDTPEFQQKAILDFENHAYLSCLKARQ